MNIPPSVSDFWDGFTVAVGADVKERFYEAFHFDDSEASADALAELVLAGVKRATAGLAWSYEAAGTHPPRRGDLSVVTNWAGQPLCVVETTDVTIMPFDAVGEAFAATEGEGDGSLRYWRDAHWNYFSRECARIDQEPSVAMPVVCERFKLIYRP